MKARNVILITIGIIISEYFIDHSSVSIVIKTIFKLIFCIVLSYALYKEIKEYSRLRDK